MRWPHDPKEQELGRLYFWTWFLVLSGCLLAWILQPFLWPEPHGSSSFSKGDIINLPLLAKKLSEGTDPLSAFLGERLDPKTKVLLASFQTSKSNTLEVETVLLEQLTRIIRGPSIYDEKLFQGVDLGTDKELLRKGNPQGQELVQLNRRLLDDAYWRELRDHKSLSGGVVLAGIVVCYILGGRLWLGFKAKKHQITGQEISDYFFRQPLSIMAGIIVLIAGIAKLVASLMH